MPKFLILYQSSRKATETMAEANPEEMQDSMNDWVKWRDEASKDFKVEFGLPVQAVGRITPEGLTASDSQASGYSIIEGESRDGLMELLKTHPHLKSPGARIDILEMLAIPGLGT